MNGTDRHDVTPTVRDELEQALLGFLVQHEADQLLASLPPIPRDEVVVAGRRAGA